MIKRLRKELLDDIQYSKVHGRVEVFRKTHFYSAVPLLSDFCNDTQVLQNVMNRNWRAIDVCYISDTLRIRPEPTEAKERVWLIRNLPVN